MAFVKNQWVDRVSDYPNRRKLVNPSDPTDFSSWNIERDEGTVSVQGTALNSTNLNNLEDRIEAMNTSLVGTPTVVTLAAADWNATSHLITVPVTGVLPQDGSNQEIMPLLATSPANIANNAALKAANIQDAGQSSGTITLYAENVPTVDLQIRIIVRF